MKGKYLLIWGKHDPEPVILNQLKEIEESVEIIGLQSNPSE